MIIKIFSICLSGIMFLFVIELIRREKLTFQFAAGWLFVSLLGIVLTIFDQVVIRLAQWAGFQLPSNFIFFTLLCVFVFLSLLMTVFLCQQSQRNEMIAQRIGLLESEIKHLKGILNNKSSFHDQNGKKDTPTS